MSRATKMPSHRVYAVVDKAKAGTGEKEDIWLNVGVAFEHVSGDGFNIVLGGIPTDRKLVMREISESDVALFSKQRDASVRRWALFYYIDSHTRRIVAWVGGLLVVQTLVLALLVHYYR